MSVIPREGVESPKARRQDSLAAPLHVIPREGVESRELKLFVRPWPDHFDLVIPREGVESNRRPTLSIVAVKGDPERGS